MRQRPFFAPTNDTSQGQGSLILYRTDDGTDELQLRLVDGTVWLTQAEIATLFDTTKQNVSLHLKTIFADDELSEGAVVKESLTTAADGKNYKTSLYNLKAILAVGYRVRSPRGSQFRRWASEVLSEYLIKGSLLCSRVPLAHQLLPRLEAESVIAGPRLAPANFDAPHSDRIDHRNGGDAARTRL